MKQLTCNEKTEGSSPFLGTIWRYRLSVRTAGFQPAKQSSTLCAAAIWGISSVGRTSDLHSEGQEFDSLILHHYGTLVQFG